MFDDEHSFLEGEGFQIMERKLLHEWEKNYTMIMQLSFEYLSIPSEDWIAFGSVPFIHEFVVMCGLVKRK